MTKAQAATAKTSSSRRSNMRRALPWLLLAAAAVAIVFGIYRGEAATVLQRAINICLECIGIG